MRIFKRAAVAAAVLLLTASAASAQTTIRWLHLEVNPNQVKIWEDVARDFEAKNPGVRVETQFLENEAYKAKLPSMLQSKDRPQIIYSWAGGVLKSQIEAGVLEDIAAPLGDTKNNLSPAAVNAFSLDGKIYGIPFAQSQVGFFYNKELMAKAGVDGAAIKTWDDLLDAVKKLKTAGITPLMVGGADKWPIHFYWTYLAVRIGGKPAFEAALRGENGGFAGETFVKSGQLFKQLVDLQPFQNGFLGFKNPQALGAFGDGKAAMTLAISSAYHQQRALAADKKGISDDNLGWLDFPTVAGGKGDPSDTLGGINGWLVTKGAPKETVTFLKYFVSQDVQKKLAAGNFLIPVYKGADEGLASPLMRIVAQNLAKSKYHQNYYDQSLGPSVGRVVNDVTAEIAGGSMTPEAAAKAIQEAYKQGN
ncbi:MAG: carbohydrate transporter substrate-binding protein family [Tardiphaga sp.]|jgi:raffinose/stachyose/melibiose transport system substrate-binding protein|nr:carbohydrate transporter substrate-binding protein family [Tardiphaga sp.]